MLATGRQQQLSTGAPLLASDLSAAVEVADTARSCPIAERPSTATGDVPAAKRARSGAESLPHSSADAERASNTERHKEQMSAEEHQQCPPVMLVLVGVQGAGKSTFAKALVQRSQQRWQRINQDSIANGSPGSRNQCLAATRSALQQGSSVVVDRAHVTQEQRRYFVSLARDLGVEAHCVMLGLPVKACQGRAAGRTDHEGGLQGHRAYYVVGMTHKALMEAGPPKHAEGFRSVITCESDAEADAARDAWASYSAGCLEPWAELDKARPAGKAAQGAGLQTIDKFFQRKLDSLAKGGAGASGSRAAAAAEPAAAGSAGPASQQPAGKQPVNAFQVLMSAAKQPPPPLRPPCSPVQGSAAGTSKHSFPPSPFINALIGYADHPERHRECVLHADESCVMVADKFPKARAHALVIARQARLQGPLDLSGPEDVALVRHLKEVGQRWAEEQQAAGAGPFALGLHSVPSMRRLHLHVISRDFDSPSLKHKKHWNSFQEPFFLPVDQVLRELDEKGTLGYDLLAKEALLKGQMNCHRCGSELKNMPVLKAHLMQCTVPRP